MTLRARLEDAHHMAIVEFLNTVLPFKEIVHVPNEGKRSPYEAARQKKLGLRPGASDLIVYVPNRVITFEVKRPECKLTKRRAGKPTEKQIDFGLNLNAMGHAFAIVETIDDVRNALKALGVQTREAKQ
jgi:hypothetical protein